MVDLSSARVNDSDAKPSIPRFRYASDAERRAFGPAEHIRAVHPPSSGTGLRRGFVVWGEKVTWTDAKGRERHWRSSSDHVGGEAEHAARKFIANGKQGTVNNLYFSMQSFRRPNSRRVKNLSALGCAFVDVDYKQVERWKGMDPCIVMSAILPALDDAKIPPPSFVMDSGNGLHAVWLHGLLPKAAEKRWNLVQERLLDALKPFGADPNAKDAARVLRLSGSWNPAARGIGRGHVHLVWIQGSEIAKPFRYDFDALADEVLPLTRAEIVVLRAERAKRRAQTTPGFRKGQKPVARRDSASYAETVLEDLHRLRSYRFPSGALPAGQRDAWLFVASMALSWITPAPALEGQILALACKVSGWREREARSRMGSIIRRAKDAAAGKKIEYDRKEVDPRYRMKAETIIKWLNVTEDEMGNAKLRVLLNPDARRERKAQDARDRRKSRGATGHGENRVSRIEIGQRAMWMHVRDGMTYAEIAAELKISKATVGKAIAEVRDALSSTRQNTEKTREAAFRAVYGGIHPLKGGGTHASGSGVLAPRTTTPKKSSSFCPSPPTQEAAASGSGTVAIATRAAQRAQKAERTVKLKQMASTPTQADRTDNRHASKGSSDISDFRRPAFLSRKAG
ncbi:sigma factor-like helix-turn-helix DNA-binding protein [Tardiphaga robiniae]|uniref:Replication protein n=1 Tax=Tardiphaga robiniae TaxID=943830 RepID=A0A109ZYC1_9BRAD|nr:sigma-70 region 4 domain-containing protein [Tardiphaga robiniae]AMH39525.1 Replication protein [Tardiphaga robiniae]